MPESAIHGPWELGQLIDAAVWEFDVGPFAGTHTISESSGVLSEFDAFGADMLVSSTPYGLAAEQPIALVISSQDSLEPSSPRWTYHYLPAGTPTTLEIVLGKFGHTAQPRSFRWLNAIALLRKGPWARFLAGFDPVPVAPTNVARFPWADEADAPASPANEELGAVEDLRRWLGITYEQVAEATSIGLRTVHHWKRSGANPRPRTVRTLWRLHTLVRSIRRALGPDEANQWFRAGARSPLDLIVAGDISAAENKARAVLFEAPVGERRFSGVQTLDEPVAAVSPRTTRLSRSTRRPITARRETP